jgi:hypothetical protein
MTVGNGSWQLANSSWQLAKIAICIYHETGLVFLNNC